MKAIMVMFDSLNRRMLSPYGCNETITPNFQRLAQRAVTFDNHYAGSMPCMPARRELHTGRLNFLHRSWGPIEPYDDSMPALLTKNGIYTFLVSDHLHYWEDGGATYHTRYSAWNAVRGQQGDFWQPDVAEPKMPENVIKRTDRIFKQDYINRQYIKKEEDFPQARTFASGEDFIRRNRNQDNWFVQIETFDPHEPFFAAERYRQLYQDGYSGPVFDWPQYRHPTETPEQIEHCRNEYKALLSMCDAYLGKILDLMDELDLWKDTMLIVNTDHGFLLGEHDWWAKCVQPFYDEVIHTPFFIWDPRCGCSGQRRSSLTQNIDIAPTLLDYFGVSIPEDMLGKPLGQTVKNDQPVRTAALFGQHGGQMNVTDGRYIYMRSCATPDNAPLYEYTLMPTHMRSMFTAQEISGAQLSQPFSFTKNCPLLKINAVQPDGKGNHNNQHRERTMLFDLQSDPNQLHPIHNPEIEQQMIRYMVQLMIENDAPTEQYTRLGLEEEYQNESNNGHV